MIFSKRKNLLLTIVTLMGLVSCSSSIEDEKKVDKSAMFRQKSFKIASSQKIGETSISRQRTHHYYTMELCLETDFTLRLKDIEATVSGTNFPTITDMTDARGCLNWEEEIKIDLSRGTYVQDFKRTITLTGLKNDEKVEVNFGINPIDGDFLDYSKVKKNRVDNTAQKFSVNDMVDMKRIRFTPQGYGEASPRNDNNVIDKPFVLFTCFNYKSTGAPMRREIIDATLTNRESGRVMEKKNFHLDESGCGEMNFSLIHERYTNTRRIKYDFAVKTQNRALQGAFVEREVCLYPWSNSGWVFGHDTLSGPCPGDAKDQRARIFVDQVSYNFMGHDHDKGFHLNDALDLVIVKTYVVSMFPRIHYGNFVHTMDPTEPIYEGRFRLKVAILAPMEGDIELTNENQHKFRVISTTSKVVHVENRRLKTRIDLPIKYNDIPFVHTRTYAAIKLEPLENTDISPLPARAAGTFHASSKVFNSILHTQVDIDDMVVNEKSSKMKELKGYLDDIFVQVNPEMDEIKDNDLIDAMLTRNESVPVEQRFLNAVNGEKNKDDYKNLTLRAATSKLKTGLTKQEVNDVFDDVYTRSTLKKFCSLFFNSKSEKFFWKTIYKDYNYEKCLEAPETMMRLSAYKHVHKVTSKPDVEFSNPIRFYTSTGSNNFHSVSDRIGNSRRINAGASISSKFELGFVSLGGGGGLDVSKMWGHDMQTGKSNREDNGMSIDLYADKLTLGFDAYVSQCITIDGLIKYKQEMVNDVYYTGGYYSPSMQVITTEENNRKRFRICRQNKTHKRVMESWYYIGEGHQFHTILRDRLSMRENKYTVLVRGEKNLAKFSNFLGKHGRNYFKKKVKNTISPDHYMTEMIKDFRKVMDQDNNLISDGAIPGTIEEFSVMGNAGDQFYGDLPVENFNPFTSPFGTQYK